MEEYYYIYTQNRFNQVLIFETYDDAVRWCQSATRWTEKEIKNNIKTPVKQGDFYSICE